MKQDNQLNTNLEAIPEKLKSMKNWIVCGTNQTQNQGESFKDYLKRTQVKAHPKNPNEDQSKKSSESWKEYGQRTSAKSNDENTWSTYEKAVEVAKQFKGFSSIGFELGLENNPSGIVAIDLDHCLTEDGKSKPNNTEFLKEFINLETYCEKSISGDGLHLFIEGTIPNAIAKHDEPAVEMYSFGRYILMTGNETKTKYPINTNQKKLDEIFKKYNQKIQKKEVATITTRQDTTYQGNILDSITIDNSEDIMQKAFTEAIQKESELLNQLFFDDYINRKGLSRTEHCLNRDNPMKHPNGDSNPSMKLNDDKYFCFSCNQAFGIVDFVQKEYNLQTKREAIRKIVEHYKGTEEVKNYYSLKKEINQKLNTLKAKLKQQTKQDELNQKKEEQEQENNAKFLEILKQKSIGNQMTSFKEKTEGDTFKPISTGIESIDKALNGGFLKESTITIGGGTSTGKTTFTLQLLENIASEENPVLYFSLEMAEIQIIAKMLSNYIYINSGHRHEFQINQILQRYTLDKEQLEVLDYYSEQFARNFGNSFLVIYPEEPTIESILDFAYRFKKTTGKTPILAVDYLQYLQGQPREDQQTAIKRSTKELKGFAIENETLCFVLFANNRESEKSKKATDISSGLGSSSIEYTADYQFTIGFTEYERKEGKKDLDQLKDENPRRMTLTIQKNRLGPTGKKIDFLFYTEVNHFQSNQKKREAKEKKSSQMQGQFR